MKIHSEYLLPLSLAVHNHTSGLAKLETKLRSLKIPASVFLHAAPLDFSPYSALQIIANLPLNSAPNLGPQIV